MASMIVKTFVFLAVLVTLSCNVSCTPPSRAFKILQRWDINYVTSNAGPDNAGAGRFPVQYDWDAEKIVGGKFARARQFPFMAVVHRLMNKGMVSQCGGTILSSRWVLTAGHCVNPQPRKFLVVFGVIDKAGITYDSYRGKGGVSMMTTKAIVHPQYKMQENDIALLQMPRDIPFGENIQPIQLAGHNDLRETFAGKTSMVIGWGKDGPSGSGTKKLKYATLPISENSACSEFWSITDKHICTEDGHGQEACQGDSGGPLIIYENNAPLQVGIVSYGDGNCPSDKPGVFTRVTSFISWIEKASGLHL